MSFKGLNFYFLNSWPTKVHWLHQLNVGSKLLTRSQSHVCVCVFCYNCFYLWVWCFLFCTKINLADFYTETITLNISLSSWPTRVECRAFLREIPQVPCCGYSNHNSLCQPATGIARVVVEIVGPSNLTASKLCKLGVDINSLSPLNDTCQQNYCLLNDAKVTQTQHIGDFSHFHMIIRVTW